MMKKITLIAAFYFLFIAKAYAYLDPGSGGILQMLLAALAAAVASISFYWSKVKDFFKRMFTKNKEKEKQKKDFYFEPQFYKSRDFKVYF